MDPTKRVQKTHSQTNVFIQLDFTGSQQHLHTHCTVLLQYFIFLQFYASPELSVMWVGSSSSPCKSVVLWSRGLVHDTAVHGTAVHDCLVTGVWPHPGHHHPHAHTDHPAPSPTAQQLSSSASPAQMWPVLTAPSLDTAPASTGSARHPAHR